MQHGADEVSARLRALALFCAFVFCGILCGVDFARRAAPELLTATPIGAFNFHHHTEPSLVKLLSFT